MQKSNSQVNVYVALMQSQCSALDASPTSSSRKCRLPPKRFYAILPFSFMIRSPKTRTSNVFFRIRCRAYIFPVVKNVPVDVSTHAQ